MRGDEVVETFAFSRLGSRYKRQFPGLMTSVTTVREDDRLIPLISLLDYHVLLLFLRIACSYLEYSVSIPPDPGYKHESMIILS